ncbi:unnamed protein product [Coccothraustes coccothraustes]
MAPAARGSGGSHCSRCCWGIPIDPRAGLGAALLESPQPWHGLARLRDPGTRAVSPRGLSGPARFRRPREHRELSSGMCARERFAFLRKFSHANLEPAARS